MKKSVLIVLGLSGFLIKTQGASGMSGRVLPNYYTTARNASLPVEIKNKTKKPKEADAWRQVYSYISEYTPLVDSLSEEYGIPSSVILGVAIIESGAGRDRNPQLMNNHFGVVGKNNLMTTMHIKTMYKQYASAADSYRDFCKIISRKKYYLTLKGNTNYEAWVSEISKAGYSTSPEAWKHLVLDAIKKYKLYSM
jgi:flagellum-specific peptidoglycan hydrolase FlgJ